MKLTDQHKRFIEHFCEYGNASEAYRAAGYNDDSGNAHRLLTRLAPEINRQHQTKMASFTGTCLAELERIITDPEAHDRDKLRGIDSYLDRVGVSRASSVNVNQRNLTEEPPNRKRVVEDGSLLVEFGRGVFMPPLEGSDEAEQRDWDYSHAPTRQYLKDLS